MTRAQKNAGIRDTAGEQEMREQEVLRANKELAAYFKGRRTEREARAALKIIKAFIRDRERLDAGSRRPLPGSPSVAAAKIARNSKAATDGRKVRRRHVRRHVPEAAPNGVDGREASAAALDAAVLPTGTG
jgi:hypothetical protein